MLLARFGIAALILSACNSLPPPPSEEVPGIRATIDELYAAFCFDAVAEPDWATQRRIYLEGACFVAPIQAGRVPTAEDTEAFLESFREFAVGGPYASTGFHERIVGIRIEGFGGIAHAFVAFEGFRPAESETVTRGLDSLQLVRDGDAWRLVSFTTQYENDGLELPGLFLDER